MGHFMAEETGLGKLLAVQKYRDSSSYLQQSH